MHEDESTPPPLDGVLETVLYYPPEREAEVETFYRHVLGFRSIGAKAGAFLFFRAGRSVLLLFNPAASMAQGSPPPHGARGPGHACFLVDGKRYEEWKGHLVRAGREIEEEAAWPRGGRSFYFRDPAGNALEIADRDIWPA
jgi:catechol 2,3-dioxygenase-like lactoylglutathione lyase family enzyme